MLLMTSRLSEERTGGVQTRIINYAKNLPKFGIKPIILSISDYRKREKTLYQNCILYKSPKESLWAFFLFFKTLLKKHKIDIIHVLEGALGFRQILALFLARIFKLKCGISFYGGELWDIEKSKIKSQKLKLKLILMFASNIVVNSKATSKFIPKKFQKKVHIVYPGVNSEFLAYNKEQNSGQQKKFNLLYVGRIIRRKGIDDILRALKIVSRTLPNVELTVVGPDTKSTPHLQLIKELNLQNQVRLIGEITDIKTLAKYYSECDVLVMAPKIVQPPCGFESFGCVFLEAGLFKKPVIGTNHFGVCEAVLDGKTGLLVSENNPKEMAKAILKLIENPELRKKLGENNYERTRKCFMDIDSTEQLAKVYL